MHRAFGYRIWLLFAAVVGLAVGGCSRASSSSGGSENGGRGGVQEARGSVGASSIDACRLLTKDEIQHQLGVPMDDGRLQKTSSQATCDWSATGDATGVGLTVNVQDFDQNLWSSFTSMGRAKAVPGVGEAAFSGVPLAGGLMIKQGKYEIDVGVVDFRAGNDRAEAAAKALAALVLPRVSAQAQGPK